MIETGAALDEIEAIIGTDGIDGLFLGPSDLSIALSHGKSLAPLAPNVDAAIDRMVAAASKAGKIAGAYCHSAERATALARRGVRFLAVMSDLGMLRAGVAAAVKVLNSG
jgi:4-hydroxy-2-oxoheptanedioate aldolase